MVAAAGENALRPVDLLQHHDSGQMVGEGHGTHGEQEVSLLLQIPVQSEGGPDEEHQLGPALIPDGLQRFGQRLGGEQLPLRRQDAQPAVFRQLLPDGLSLPLQCLPDLGRGGILRQTDLRQLDEPDPAVCLEPFFIFLRRGEIELLLELSQGDQRRDAAICSTVCSRSLPGSARTVTSAQR